ncbi:MAG TPA: ABC transporter substrate-binding protein [Kiritimatiellia bacterium]|nr:ABC transporter substrate-binding protein [Kiritimatiellia bacterium]
MNVSRRFAFPLLAFGLALAAAFTVSCALPSSLRGTPPLRVGLAPDLPPLAFMQDGRMAGLELELARDLARALGRPVEVSSMPWKGLLRALEERRIDVIMGGITITEERRTLVAFTHPVLESGLLAMIRAGDLDTLNNVAALHERGGQLGVMPGTTSDAFVQREFRKGRRVPVARAEDAPILLQRRSIDAFVHDLPALVWLHSRNAANTALVPQLLHREQIAWALRRDDEALRSEIDAVLSRWKQDGSLDTAIHRWLPYYGKLVAHQSP